MGPRCFFRKALLNVTSDIVILSTGTLLACNFNSAASSITGYTDGLNANGNVAPIRTLTSASFTNLFDCVVDSSDNLLVVANGPGRILVFRNASTRNGLVSPDISLTVTGAVGTQLGRG